MILVTNRNGNLRIPLSLPITINTFPDSPSAPNVSSIFQAPTSHKEPFPRSKIPVDILFIPVPVPIFSDADILISFPSARETRHIS